jgi:hypothetical protein
VLAYRRVRAVDDLPFPVQVGEDGRHAGGAVDSESAVPNWRPGDAIYLGRRTLRVVAVRDDDADELPVLVVE